MTEIGYSQKSDQDLRHPQSTRISASHLSAPNSQRSHYDANNYNSHFDFVAPIKYKLTHKSRSRNHFRLHSNLEGLLQANKPQNNFISLNSNRPANPARLRNSTDNSLPKLDLKHIQRNNAQPGGLLSKSLEFSHGSHSSSLPRLSHNRDHEVSYSSRRQVTSNSIDLLPENQIANFNRERNFFTVKPLGKQKRIRNLSDMYENMHIHPQSDLIVDSQRSGYYDGLYESEMIAKTSPNRQLPQQILENSNEESMLTDYNQSGVMREETDIIQEPIYIDTNNIYKQRALLKKQTISQIKSDAMRYLKSSLTQKKELEISPVLKIRKN